MQVTRKDLETIIYGAAKGISPGLEFVRVEPGKLVSCNGKMLIIREVHSELDDEFEPFCLSVADIKSAIRANAELWKTNGASVKLDPGDDFMAKIGCKSVMRQEDAYPDWESVLVKKNKPGCQTAIFDLANMMKALQGMKDIDRVELRIWDEKSAARLDGVTADGRKVLSLVMPATMKR